MQNIRWQTVCWVRDCNSQCYVLLADQSSYLCPCHVIFNYFLFITNSSRIQVSIVIDHFWGHNFLCFRFCIFFLEQGICLSYKAVRKGISNDAVWSRISFENQHRLVVSGVDFRRKKNIGSSNSSFPQHLQHSVLSCKMLTTFDIFTFRHLQQKKSLYPHKISYEKFKLIIARNEWGFQCGIFRWSFFLSLMFVSCQFNGIFDV